MRHHNPTSTSCCSFRRGKIVKKPFYRQYVNSYNNSGFAKATPDRMYVRVLQYIADHPGCKRIEFLVGCGYANERALTDADWRRSYRGEQSSMISQLLYIDVIDYDKNYRYYITDKGLAVLKTAYTNANLKLVCQK